MAVLGALKENINLCKTVNKIVHGFFCEKYEKNDHNAKKPINAF